MSSSAVAVRPSPESSLRRRAGVLFSGLLLIALLVGTLFGDGGFLQLLEERERTTALAAELGRLRGENSRLGEEIAALRSDPAAIERLAREELGMARPGETVFLVRRSPSPDHP
jgi:cell division protein FtsB